MLAAFEQHTDDNVGIAARRESDKPPVLRKIFVGGMLGASGQRNNLRRSRLPRDVNPRNVRRGSRALWQQHPSHSVGDEVPPVHLDRDAFYFRVMIDFQVVLGKSDGVNDMRHHHAAVHRDGGDSPHQLYRRGGHRPLSDAHRNGFAGKPLLLEVADLPLLRRHDARGLIRKINPGLLPQPERSRVLGDAVNAQLLGQGVKKDIARLEDRPRQIDFTVAGFHPASEPPAIERRTPIAVHIEGLRDPFLPARDRHNDLEGRAGRELRLDGPVEQRFLRIGHQLAPVVARDAHRELVGIEGGPAHHGQNLAGVRIHGDDGAVFARDGLLGGNLQIDIDGQLQRLAGLGGLLG